MPTTTDQGRLWRMAQSYRDELEAGNVSAADRMTRGWLEAQKRVDVEVQALLAKMEAARLAGTPPSPAWLYQQKRLATIRETIAIQVNQWAPMAEDATREAAERAVRAGERHARTLTREAARVSLPGVEATFTDLNPENLASLLGHLQPGGPMRDLLVRLGGEAADAAEAALVQGVMLGKGSDWIARQLRTALDIPRWRAETIARTEALRAYRETSRLTYRSSNVVGTWVWRAYIDRRTCAACVVMDGTEHPLEERLDGHPRCRCTMEPRTKTWGDIHPDLADLPDTRPPLGTPGKEWLAAQPDSVKLALMGPGKLRAYQAGEITLDDLVARPHSPEWGSMRRERSLAEIREGRNPNTPGPVSQPQAPDAPDLTDLPRSRYPQAELESYAQRLRAVDDDIVRANVQQQKDPAVRELAKRELARRETTPSALAQTKAALAEADEWLGGLPKKKPGMTQPRAVTLENVSPAITRHLEGQPGLRITGMTVDITDHATALKSLERARDALRREALMEAKETGRLSAMDALRVKRMEDYMDRVRGGSARQADDLLDTNPLYRTERAYQVNCTHVVSAWELRRRGYDVTASALPQAMVARGGRSWEDIFRRWKRDAPGALDDDVAYQVTRLQGERKMKTWGEGATAVVRVVWKGRGAGGHVFIAQMKGGVIHYLDPQTGGRDVTDYFNQMRGKADFYRLDNRTPTPELEEMIERRER